MKIVAISDTHGYHNNINIPDGDILIHAGDVTRYGEIHELSDINYFFHKQPHKYKILIAGNHDICFERQLSETKELLNSVTYLQDESICIEGINIYGSPWQPWFRDWSFNLQRGPQLKEKWDMIPENTDILITHGPPFGILDKTKFRDNAGCKELKLAIDRIKPKLHIFGHIHEAYGKYIKNSTNTTCINASICNVQFKPVYKPVNKPTVIEYKSIT